MFQLRKICNQENISISSVRDINYKFFALNSYLDQLAFFEYDKKCKGAYEFPEKQYFLFVILVQLYGIMIV